MFYELIEGDILNSNIQYITHQTNCVSSGAAGLAYYLFNKYPYSNVYKNRIKTIYDPGSLIVSGNGTDQRYIINMFSQYYPGGPNEKDNQQIREVYFKACLSKIEKLPNLYEIAFPYKIGCGLAGGDWDKYEEMINNFAYYNAHQFEVYIVKRKEDI